MPQFVLDHGSPEASRAFAGLDAFTRGYIECMFFTETGYPENEDLEHTTLAQLAPEALADIVEDCRIFQEQHHDDLTEALDNGRINGYDEERAGHDFWLTRNGHGAGFWDRGLGDVGDKLSEAAKTCGSRYLYRGDNGKLSVG